MEGEKYDILFIETRNTYRHNSESYILYVVEESAIQLKGHERDSSML